MDDQLFDRIRRELTADQRADLALVLAVAALQQSSRRPKRKSLADRLWDLV